MEDPQGRPVHERHDHDPQRRLRRPRRALRRARRDPGWDTAGFDDCELGAGLRDRPAPAAGQHDPRHVQPPRPGAQRSRVRDDEAEVAHDARRRQRGRGLRQGDLGDAADRASRTASPAGAGDADELPAQQHDAVRGDRRGRHNIKVASVANFVAGDKITIDQAANGFGAGDPETRTITASGRPARPAPASRSTSRSAAPTRTRASSRARARARRTHDTQGSELRWWYTQKDGAQTGQPHTLLGLAVPAGAPARRGGDLRPTTSPRSCSTRRRPRAAAPRSTPTTRRSTRSST